MNGLVALVNEIGRSRDFRQRGYVGARSVFLDEDGKDKCEREDCERAASSKLGVGVAAGLVSRATRVLALHRQRSTAQLTMGGRSILLHCVMNCIFGRWKS
jgi:hypothetical protein